MKNTRLREIRKKSGLTQTQAAQQVGVTPRAYQYYESGEREPGVRTAIRIAKALKTTVEKIF